MLVVAFAALLGLFGGGPIARATAGTRNSALFVRYDRFTRQNAPHTLVVELGGRGVAPDSTAQLWLDRQWLMGNEITAITPQPLGAVTMADRIVYTFRIAPGGRGAIVTFSLNTKAAGTTGGRIGLANGPAYSFPQFTYP